MSTQRSFDVEQATKIFNELKLKVHLDIWLH